MKRLTDDQRLLVEQNMRLVSHVVFRKFSFPPNQQ